GSLTADRRPSPIRRAMPDATVAAASNDSHRPEANGHVSETESHVTISTLEMLEPPAASDLVMISDDSLVSPHRADRAPVTAEIGDLGVSALAQEEPPITEAVELPSPPPVAAAP